MNSLFGFITLNYIINVFLFLSIRFDGDVVTKETPEAVPREGPTPASKPAKGTKVRDVSKVSFLLENRLIACVCRSAFLCCECINESWQDISQSYTKNDTSDLLYMKNKMH